MKTRRLNHSPIVTGPRLLPEALPMIHLLVLAASFAVTLGGFRSDSSANYGPLPLGVMPWSTDRYGSESASPLMSSSLAMQLLFDKGNQ